MATGFDDFQRLFDVVCADVAAAIDVEAVGVLADSALGPGDPSRPTKEIVDLLIVEFHHGHKENKVAIRDFDRFLWDGNSGTRFD